MLLVTWRRGQPGFTNQTPELPTAGSLQLTARRVAQAAIQFSVVLTPAVLLAGPLRICRAAWQRAPRTTIGVFAASILGFAVDLVVERRSGTFLGPDRFTGNQWTLASPRHDLAPRSVLPFLALVGLFSLVVLLCAAVPPIVDTIANVQYRRPVVLQSTLRPILVITALGFGGAHLLGSATDVGYFLRYLLPLVPIVAILVLSARSVVTRSTTNTRLVGVAALGLLATLGAIFSAANASFDGTKWHLAQEMSRSATIAKVDGGFEWNNYHAGDVLYRWSAHPKGTCIRIVADDHRPSADGAVGSERVWTFGTDVWIVARKVAEC
jgi:hypothetical protein